MLLKLTALGVPPSVSSTVAVASRRRPSRGHLAQYCQIKISLTADGRRWTQMNADGNPKLSLFFCVHANHRCSEINQSVFKLLRCHHLPNQQSPIPNLQSPIPLQSGCGVSPQTVARASRPPSPPPWLWRLAADRREGVSPSVPSTVAVASRRRPSRGRPAQCCQIKISLTADGRR